MGIIDIRHYLKEEHFHSGHIGYSVCPAERCKGCGTEILRLGIEKAKALSLQRVLLSCYKDNAASRKVIENNGGVFEKEVLDDGKALLIFWIDIP